MDTKMYAIIAAACFAAAAVAVLITVMVMKNKLKGANEELERAKTELEEERSSLTKEKESLAYEQDNLKNAQLVFMQEKTSRDNLEEKTEKDLAVDTFVKMGELEQLFAFLKNNIASVDGKLVGVKDYSEDLTAMRTDLEDQIGSLKSEMTELQNTYSAELKEIHEALKTSLTNVEGQIQEIVSGITNAEMGKMVTSVTDELAEIKGSVDTRMASLAGEFGEQITRAVGEPMKQSDVQSAVRSVMGEYTISSLNADDVKGAVEKVLGDTSAQFTEGLKSIVRDEVMQNTPDMNVELTALAGKLNAIETTISRMAPVADPAEPEEPVETAAEDDHTPVAL